MRIIITALNENGKRAIIEISQEKHKLLTLEEERLIIKIPSHLAPFLKVINKGLGISPQYEEFIKKTMEGHKAYPKDYSFKVE